MKHPYIVGYRDFWRDNLTVYIVMEYCEGGDMALLIEQQQSHFPEQVRIAFQNDASGKCDNLSTGAGCAPLADTGSARH